MSATTSFPALSHEDARVKAQLNNGLCRFHIGKRVRSEPKSRSLSTQSDRVTHWHINIGTLRIPVEGLCELRMGCRSFDILASCMLSYLIVVFVVSPSLSLVACHMAVPFSSPVSETNETITRISQWLMPLTCQPARQAR